MRALLRACAWGLLALAGQAVSVEPGGEATANGTLAGFHYQVIETPGAAAGAELPMIVGLHYSGAAPGAMTDYLDGFDMPVRIVLPQGRHPRPGGHSWFAAGHASLPEQAQQQAAESASDEVAAFVLAAQARYPTRGKPLVMGISYGGDLALMLAIRHPRLIAAAFPVAARFPPGWMPARVACASPCASIHALHGTADTTVPLAPTARAIERLRALGFDATLVAYAGVAHDFSPGMQQDFVRQAQAVLQSR